MLNQFIDSFRSTLEFSIANAFFALSTWVAMWAGLLSFAAVSFGAVGAFVAAWIYLHAGGTFAMGLVAGTAAATAFAFLISFPLLRLDSHWMALATVALILITRVFVLNLENVTGGAVGTPVIEGPNWIWLIGLIAGSGFVLARLRRSKLGMAAEAVREDVSVAAAMGIKVSSIQRSALILSGVFGGIGGVVLAGLVQYISPDTFYIPLAFVMVSAVILGGSHHWAGPILGAVVFTTLPDLLRAYLPVGDEIVNGFLIILIMIFLPRGIIDPARFRFRWLRRKSVGKSLELEKVAV